MKKSTIEETPLLLWARRSKFLLASAAVLLMTALFSKGFLHPDEHFQILELVNLKRSDSYINMSIFNWDFFEKIRPWIQPFFYTYFLRPFEWLSPFHQATLIRIFNGSLGLLALHYFLKTIPKSKASHLLFVMLIWFVPFLLVRTNSESLSFSLFCFGYYLYSKGRFPWAMFLWGLMFLVRYQMAIMVMPIVIYGVVKRNISLKSFSLMIVALTFSLLLGVLIDYWGYEQWVLAPYNYFYQNLVLKKSSNFGVEPFYYYFTKPLVKGIPPLSLFILFFGVKNLMRKKDFALGLGLLFFTLIHSLIPHKEIRFLMPVYLIIALYSAQGFEEALKRWWGKGLLLLSLLIMLKTSLTPAHSRLGLYEYAFNHHLESVQVFPRHKDFTFSMPFFMTKPISVTTKGEQFSGHVLALKLDEFKVLTEKKDCQLLYSQYPSWIESVNYSNWLSRSSFYSFWSCESSL